MDITTAKSTMSQSLLARDVYRVCFTDRDTPELLRDELAAARKKFFTENKHTVRVGKSEIVKGFDGKLHGKLTKHGLYWKKTAGKLPLEQSFDLKNGYVLVRRDFRNVIVSRTYFDKNHLWLKSEYFSPNSQSSAQVMFKPCDSSELVERFDLDTEHNRYRATELHPLPYMAGTAEQSILNARFGEPTLIISTAEGEFCYCPKHEAQQRKRALDDIKDGTIVLMPAWEVKDGTLASEADEEETNVTFTSLEEYAKIEPGQPVEASPESPEPAGPLEQPTEEFTPADLPEQPESEATPTDENEEILAAARKAAQLEAATPEAPSPTHDEKIVSTAIAHRQNGLTAYNGEYRDGKRDGFGSYYYKDGSLCYAGFWRDDKKDGLGVSFRDTDHALHIAKWQNGQPGGIVSLFDSEGSLRFGGRIVNGKKEGAGVSINQADGTVFVGKWENGQPTGLGSSFDRDGNLLYYGNWRDGKRDGHGTEFDQSGAIVFDGEWKDGKYHNGILYQKLRQDDLPEEESPLFDM